MARSEQGQPGGQGLSRNLRRLTPTEVDECVALAGWLNMHHVVYIHVPNEGNLNRMGQLKNMGLQPGFPDYIIFDTPPARPQFKGTVIEMKSATGKATPEQRRWLLKLENRGYYTTVCNSGDEAIELCLELGYHRLHIERSEYNPESTQGAVWRKGRKR